jgi:hypothetical protein
VKWVCSIHELESPQYIPENKCYDVLSSGTQDGLGLVIEQCLCQTYLFIVNEMRNACKNEEKK